MNTNTIPKSLKNLKDYKDLALYIWRCIDLPLISMEDLLFFLSFQLYRFKPSEATQIVNEFIKNSILIKEKGFLKLSNELDSSFIKWQEEEGKKVEQAMGDIGNKTEIKKKLEKGKRKSFNLLLKELSDEKTLDKAVTISKNSFKKIEVNFDQGIIRGNVSGTRERPYYFEINIKEQTISHDCHDFVSNKSRQKLFCKHIVKLFLILKPEYENRIEDLFREIIHEIKDWDFS